MRTRPKFIEVTHRVVLPIQVVVFGGLGVRRLTRGDESGAIAAFLIAALAPASMIAYYVTARAARRRVPADTVSLRVDALTALDWTTEALRQYVTYAEPEIDRERLTVSTVVSEPTWISLGERLVAVIHHSDGSSDVRLKVEMNPQLVGLGKARGYVAAVKRLLLLKEEERDAIL
jgi:hypothetical protein